MKPASPAKTRPAGRRAPLAAAALALAALAPAPSPAQAPPSSEPPGLPPGINFLPSGSTYPQVINLDAESSEKQAETVARGVADLASEDAGVRAAAAKLLGKYQLPAARAALLEALGDPDVRVRRAALISLVERFSITDRPSSERILSCLADPDTEVRRAVANTLPYLSRNLSSYVSSASGSTTITVRGGVRTITSNPSVAGASRARYRLPDALRETLLKAFADPDPIVRQNVMRYFSLFGIRITEEILGAGLADPDREVVIYALNHLLRVPLTPELVGALAALARREDAGIKQKVALSLMNVHDPRSQEILQGLSGDDDPFVSVVAKFSLAKATRTAAPETLESITEFLLSTESAPTQLMSLVYNLSTLGEASGPVYQALTAHKSAKVRRVAWSRYLSYDQGWNDPARWLPALEDPSPDVRNQIASTLRSGRTELSRPVLEQLVRSRYPDVRTAAASALGLQTPEVASELAFELLIDEEVEVRKAALRAVATRQLPGWSRILARSLHDPDEGLRREAVVLLRSIPATGEPILNDYVSKNPDTPLAAYIDAQLRYLEQRRKAAAAAAAARAPRIVPRSPRAPRRISPFAPAEKEKPEPAPAPTPASPPE